MRTWKALLALGGLAALVLLVPGVEVDPFGAFLVALALVTASLSLVGEVEPKRVVLQAGLVVVAVSTRHLAGIAAGTLGLFFLASPTAVLPAVAVLAGCVLLAISGGSLDLGALGSAADTAGAGAGAVLLLAGLLLGFVLLTRRSLGDPHRSIPAGAWSSVAALIASAGATIRIEAWLPDLDRLLEPTLTLAASFGLIAGSLGALASVRLRAFVAWVAIAQGGLLALALVGGVHGRPASLVQLATSTAAILLLALGCSRRRAEEPLTLGDLAEAPIPRVWRAIGLTGALAALSLPPFPGYPARLETASALLSRGEVTLVVLSIACTAVLGFGIVRFAVPLIGAPGARAEGKLSMELLALALVLAAIGILGLVPGPLVLAARASAAGLF